MDISQTLQQLEALLLTRTTRQNAQQIGSLLTDEFREFGSSGQVFTKVEIIDRLREESPVKLSLHSFEVCPLADHAFLATYRVVKEATGMPSSESLRSSIWILREERWQMVFHQGTTISEQGD